MVAPSVRDNNAITTADLVVLVAASFLSLLPAGLALPVGMLVLVIDASVDAAGSPHHRKPREPLARRGRRGAQPRKQVHQCFVPMGSPLYVRPIRLSLRIYL